MLAAATAAAFDCGDAGWWLLPKECLGEEALCSSSAGLCGRSKRDAFEADFLLAPQRVPLSSRLPQCKCLGRLAGQANGTWLHMNSLAAACTAAGLKAGAGPTARPVALLPQLLMCVVLHMAAILLHRQRFRA